MNENEKATLIKELLQINNALDTYRTNINILIYNVFKNQLKEVPKFNYEQTKKVIDMLGNLISGTIKNYNDLKLPEEKKATVNKEQEKKGNKK